MKRFGLIINYLTFVLLFLSLLIQSSSLVQAGKLALLVLNAFILYRITTKDAVLKTIHTFNYLFIAAIIIFVVYATAYKADLYPNIILEFIIGSLIGISLSVWHKDRKKRRVERQLKLTPPRRPYMKESTSEELSKPVVISSETSTAKKTTKKAATKKATKKKTAKKTSTKKATKKATTKKATSKKAAKKKTAKKKTTKKTAKKATKKTATKKVAKTTAPKKSTKTATKKAVKKATPQNTAQKNSTKKKRATTATKKTATKNKPKQTAVQSKTTRSPRKVVKTITTTKEY